MNADSIKKLTNFINTFILILVVGLMFFFHICKATIMVMFSIPTMLVYLIGYILIIKDKLYAYVLMVYGWLTLYMSLATVCLGYTYGFHLYSLSMIPILYYITYIAFKLNKQSVTTGIFSAAIIICYLICTIYVSLSGPIYKGDNRLAALFWITNSLIVFTFLIIYTKLLINTTISSERKLAEMSYLDRLTGLYNRHYMMEQLETAFGKKGAAYVSMIDIDDFKKINDVYGHNAGDHVLKELADLMRKNADGSIVSRWGGEEFLILLKEQSDVRAKMDAIRKKVSDQTFSFEGQTIGVSVTIGLAEKSASDSIDKWIQKADKNLYIGKKNGKNVVIGE